VATRNGLAYQHSHLEAFGRDNWGRIDKTLGLHEEARTRGVDGGFDVIPYVAANTTLLAIFPPWSLEGGVDALLGRLQDPDIRSAIRRSIEEDVPGWPCWIPGGWPHNLIEATGWDNVRVMWVESDQNKAAEGRSLTQLAEDRGLHPFDVAADLVVAEKGHVMALYFGVSGEEGDEACLEQIASHPFASFETDAIVTGRGVPHPAGYGAFPRVLGHFCRDRHLFPLEDAVRRITSLPAQRFGLRHRGMIRAGNFADLTIFDPETVTDRTSYRDPAVPPEGINKVLINGQVVLEETGYRGDELVGQVLRRGATNA
jgi:N-acyl-D-amino-acid deacylase